MFPDTRALRQSSTGIHAFHCKCVVSAAIIAVAMMTIFSRDVRALHRFPVFQTHLCAICLALASLSGQKNPLSSWKDRWLYYVSNVLERFEARNTGRIRRAWRCVLI